MARRSASPRRMTLFENNKDTHDEAVSIARHLRASGWPGELCHPFAPSHGLYRGQGTRCGAGPTDYTAKQSQEPQPSTATCRRALSDVFRGCHSRVDWGMVGPFAGQVNE